MIRDKIVKTDTFKKAVLLIYTTVDLDGDGLIDRDELIIAITQLSTKISESFPGVASKPSKELIDKTLNDCDLDKSGNLSQDEFEVFATKWFENQSASLITSLAMSSAMTMVVLPSSASLLQDAIPPLKIIPNILFKVVFGMIYKIGAVVLKNRSDAQKTATSSNADPNPSTPPQKQKISHSNLVPSL